jgi:hypothetical protein
MEETTAVTVRHTIKYYSPIYKSECSINMHLDVYIFIINNHNIMYNI